MYITEQFSITTKFISNSKNALKDSQDFICASITDGLIKNDICYNCEECKTRAGSLYLDMRESAWERSEKMRVGGRKR